MKKLLYYCSYVPADMLKNAGFEMKSIHELLLDARGNANLPGSPCSFLRFCGDIPYEKYDGIIFANCCNSSQRMYDFVKYHHPDMFTYIMEVPRASNEKWDCQDLLRALKDYFGCCVEVEQKNSNQPCMQYNMPDNETNLLILSSALHQEYLVELEKIFSRFSCHFVTCYSEKRGFRYLMGEEVSCPRMLDYFSYISKLISRVCGVIFISLKNCDPILFAYPGIHRICQENKINCLVVEEEYKTVISSRSRIRYEAFLEGLEMGQRKNVE